MLDTIIMILLLVLIWGCIITIYWKKRSCEPRKKIKKDDFDFDFEYATYEDYHGRNGLRDFVYLGVICYMVH
jgi:hypothetical protein